MLGQIKSATCGKLWHPAIVTAGSILIGESGVYLASSDLVRAYSSAVNFANTYHNCNTEKWKSFVL